MTAYSDIKQAKVDPVKPKTDIKRKGANELKTIKRMTSRKPFAKVFG